MKFYMKALYILIVFLFQNKEISDHMLMYAIYSLFVMFIYRYQQPVQNHQSWAAANPPLLQQTTLL